LILLFTSPIINSSFTVSIRLSKNIYLTIRKFLKSHMPAFESELSISVSNFFNPQNIVLSKQPINSGNQTSNSYFLNNLRIVCVDGLAVSLTN